MNKRNWLKYFRRVFLMVTIPLLISGCWDRKEINDMAFVLASSIDKEGDLYRVSVLIPLPGNMGGGGGGGGGTGGVEPYTIQSEVGISPWEAVNKIQSRLPRKLFFAHRRVILFGEDVAKEGLTLLLDSLARKPENRLSTFAAVTEGKAADYLSAKVKLERFSAELMRELLQSDATVNVSVKNVVSSMNTAGKEAFLPYLELNKIETNNNKSDDIQAAGFSITKKGKQVAVLKGKESMALRLLLPKFKGYSETLKIKEGKFSFQFRNSSTQITPLIAGNQISFNISVVGVADIYEFLGTKNILEEIPDFKRQIEMQLKSDLLNVLNTLKMKGSDVVGFGQILNKRYPVRWAKVWEPQWDTLFAKTNFNVSVKINIYDVGSINENMAKQESS